MRRSVQRRSVVVGRNGRKAHGMTSVKRHGLRRPADRKRKNHKQKDKYISARHSRLKILES